MTSPSESPVPRTGRAQISRWAAFLVVAVVLGLAAWNRQGPTEEAAPKSEPKTSASSEADKRSAPSSDVHADSKPDAKTDAKPDSKPDAQVRKADAEGDDKRLRIPDVTVRDQNGRVAYKGEIDLKPTLDRIAAGKKLQHRNDGTTFENREGRIPKKPSGYYKEYVHPTPDVSGPGPQRIVIGEEGEVFYTHDHYRSFMRIR